MSIAAMNLSYQKSTSEQKFSYQANHGADAGSTIWPGSSDSGRKRRIILRETTLFEGEW